MKTKLYLLFIIVSFIITKTSNAQTNICGTVINSETNQAIFDVNIWIENTQIGTSSDNEGKFCIEIPEENKGKTTLIFSQIEYTQKKQEIDLKQDISEFKIKLTPTSVQLTEVIVSSNKSTRSAQAQTTIPVIISKDMILENNHNNISEILIKQAGISLAGTGYHKAPSIRGLARKRVVVMVDGEKVSSERNVGAPGTFINPYEIEKIEILKGPYSTLYGSDALGGVINIITKPYDKPFYLDKFGGRVDMSYRSESESKNINIALNGKIKKFQYRVSGGFREAFNYTEGDGDKSFNSFFKEKHVRAKLKYDINEKHEISLKSYYSQGGPIGFPAFSTNVNAIHDYDNHFIVGINYKMKKISKLLEKIEFNFTKHDHYLGADIIVHKEFPNPNNDKRVSMRKDLKSDDYIAQIDAYFNIHKKIKLLAGFDGYFRENINVKARKIVTNYHTGVFVMEVNDVSLKNSSQRSYGVFTQAEYALSKKINLNAGVRWNYITTQQPDKPEENRTNNAIVGNVGMSYAPNKNFSIKANAGTAFRAPDIKELYVTTQTPGGMNISNPELKPERSLNLDLAFVYQAKSSFVQLGVFQNRIYDMILLDWDYSTNPRTGTYQNIGQALLYGVEFSFNQKITKSFSSHINLSKTFGYNLTSNDELMDVPPFQINAGLNYKLKNFMWFKLSGRYSAEQINVAYGDFPTEAFTLLDFSTRWKIEENINMTFSITNILNETYREHFHFDWIQAPGRSFNIGANINF